MVERRLTRRVVLSATVGVVTTAMLPRTATHSLGQEPTWEPLVIDGSGPPARWDHSLAADEETGLLLLFGGRDASGAALNDTWTYDIASSAWSEVEGESPSARFGAASASDPANRRIYLFGGQSDSLFFNDTWRFDFKAMEWRLQDGGETVAPTPRYGLGGVIDGDGNFLVSHGFTFEGRFDDTWLFDTRHKSWADRSPAPENRPLKRCLHELVSDLDANRVLLYGGCSSGFGPCPQGDLWSLDLASDVWTDITPANGPSARSNPSLVWNSADGQAVLFGGSTDAGQVNDLWYGTFDGDSFVWSQASVIGDSPSPRSSHDAVLVGDEIYLFGGTGPNGVLNDLWRLKV
jgi:hypothetical protein